MIPVNILIVDDRPENIIALEALLQHDGINIFSSTSPNEALKLAWEKQIAIALVDVQMPEMDGFEFVETLKSNPRTRDIMVIFVTAISKDSKYAVKGFGVGAVDYLYKPLDPTITVAKVDSFIQLARHNAEIKQKNEALENYAVVVKNSADVICVVNSVDLSIQSINPAVEKLLGYKPDVLVGKNIAQLVIEDDRIPFIHELKGLLNSNNTSAVFEYRFLTANQTVVWTESRVAFQNSSIFLNINDISSRKNYHKQLITSKEKAENSKKVKEVFFANMSHELRTPVNGIIGLTTSLRKTPLNEQQHSMIDLLQVSSQSLLGIINDVLDISKIEAGKFTIIRASHNIYDLLRAVYGLLKFTTDENNIEFLLEIDPELPEYLMVDSLRLNQILMNLLSNAIKFTESGYVKLKVTVLEKQQEQVQLQFTVEDSGIGIPTSKLDSVFDSFEQAEDNITLKYGGTGLGLAIVKQLAALKGGTINVESKYGKGSTFTFINWYTIGQKIAESTTEITDKVLMPFKNVSVLIAEDNFVNQFMLSKLLKDWGIDVDIVDNGIKVLEKLRTDSYNLILMDTHMPEMGGYETARAIRNDFDEPVKSIPIISLSAASFEHERAEAIQAGMNAVLSKPFQPAELHYKIETVLK